MRPNSQRSILSLRRRLFLVGLAAALLVGAIPSSVSGSAVTERSVHAGTDARAVGVTAPSFSTPSVTSVTFPPPDWRWLNATNTSPPAVGGGVAYLPGAHAVVWVGGDDAGAVETWEFQNGSWTNLTGGVTGAPPTDPGGLLAAAPFADEVAWTSPFAGSPTMGLWTFANRTWTNDSGRTPSPPARVDGAWGPDPTAATIVLFGGVTNGIYRNDTWTLGSSGWSAVSPSAAPSPRALAGLAAPGSGTAVVLSGGVGYDGALNDTWTFSGSTWAPVAAAGAPLGLATGPDALAPTPGGDLLGFGGVGCSAPSARCNDTYEYLPSLGAWRNVTSQGPPSPRTGTELVYDAAQGYDLAFGGVLDSGAPASQTWAIGGPLVTDLVVTPTVAQPPSSSRYISHAGGGYGTYTYVFSGQNVDCISRNVSNYYCPLDNDDNGNYTITGQVTDQMGNVTRASDPFTVLRSLDVLANLSASVVDAGQPVTYAMTVSAPSIPVTIRWQNLPPDCPVANLSAFICASSVPGFYGVSCNVTDQYGTAVVSTTLQLVVHADPTILAWPSVQGGTAPLTVDFASSVSGGTGPFLYHWNFGDGTFGTGPDPAHTYAANGSFLVSVTATDALGVNATLAQPISVTASPALSAAITVATTGWAAPAHVDFTATVSGGTAPYSYRWTFGNEATGATAAANTTYGEPGTYTATVTVLDARGLVTTASTVLTIVAASANSTTGAGGGGSAPAWELAGLALGGAAVGLVLGVVLGRRRRSGPAERS